MTAPPAPYTRQLPLWPHEQTLCQRTDVGARYSGNGDQASAGRIQALTPRHGPGPKIPWGANKCPRSSTDTAKSWRRQRAGAGQAAAFLAMTTSVAWTALLAPVARGYR